MIFLSMCTVVTTNSIFLVFEENPPLKKRKLALAPLTYAEFLFTYPRPLIQMYGEEEKLQFLLFNSGIEENLFIDVFYRLTWTDERLKQFCRYDLRGFKDLMSRVGLDFYDDSSRHNSKYIIRHRFVFLTVDFVLLLTYNRGRFLICLNIFAHGGSQNVLETINSWSRNAIMKVLKSFVCRIHHFLDADESGRANVYFHP